MPCHTPEVEIGGDDETLVVVWQDGHASSYGWLWLRDCCGCEQCRGDGTTQRLADVASLPAAPRPASVACRGEDLVVSWSPDGHESRHELARLRARCACCEHAWASTEPRDRWNAATEGIPARRTLEELRADESALEAWLAAGRGIGDRRPRRCRDLRRELERRRGAFRLHPRDELRADL